MTDLLDQLQDLLAAEYHLERELGGGGMSRVFLATETGLQRRVVIKVLPPDLAGSVSLERFRREIQVAAGLQHPHIVPILRAGSAGDLLYYTMPFVNGESLRSRLARGPVPPVEAARILRDVADALAYAHRHQVAHRDVKPDNILLADGHALVTDFGVARALGASGKQTLTATGIAIGTPLYMAPEQAAGDPQADHRVDLYALGVVAYEMLVGEPPFSGLSPQAILAAQLTERAAPVRRRAPGTPPELAVLIDHCLDKDPLRRAQSADDLVEQLSTVATPSGSTPAGRMPRRWRLTDRRALALAAVLAVLVVAGGAELLARARARTLLADALPVARAGRFDEVSALVQRAGADPGSRRLRPLAAVAAGRLRVESTPPGAAIELLRVHPIVTLPTREALAAGRTPRTLTLIAGEYLVRLRSAGASIELPATIVPGGELRLSGAPAPDSAGFVIAGAIRIGRTEVTNAEYERFVASGGYRDSSLWDAGAPAAQFVDRTGGPGPQSWSNGAPPAGEGRRPVTGISWYEAAAYARWAGHRLPTAAEWYYAATAGRGPFPWGTDAASAEDRANFGGVGVVDVATRAAGLSPFGAYDMAGNVREWVDERGPDGVSRLAVGGSWQEPPYGFERGYASPLDPAVRRNTVGFRLAATLNESAGR